MITEVFGLEEGDVEWTSMGASGIDIKLSPRARSVCPVSIECKKQKKHPAVAEMKQARYNAYTGTIAAVAWSPHGSGPEEAMITFNMREFFNLLKELQDERKG
jgi:hypothetical protein